MKAWMVCYGLKPGGAGWKVQTNPLSNGGPPRRYRLIGEFFHIFFKGCALVKFFSRKLIIER